MTTLFLFLLTQYPRPIRTLSCPPCTACYDPTHRVPDKVCLTYGCPAPGSPITPYDYNSDGYVGLADFGVFQTLAPTLARQVTAEPSAYAMREIQRAIFIEFYRYAHCYAEHR